MSITYISPTGEETMNPSSEFLSSLLLSAGKDYWEAGSGDAALRCKQNSEIKSELIIMLREPFGVFVQFVDPQTSHEFVLSDTEINSEEITIQQGGEPWELPRRYFVAREDASKAVNYFLSHCERVMDLRWERF